MTEEKEYFIDYIAIGIIGFAIGQAIASVGGSQRFFGEVFGTFGGIDWGRTVGSDVVTAIFAFLPAGFVAGYLCYKMLKAKGNMAGFTGGFMSFLAYFIITLIIALVQTGSRRRRRNSNGALGCAHGVRADILPNRRILGWNDT
jgi:hypothetical protein